MKTWQQILRDHDPIEPLSADETATIRRRVVAEAARAARSSAPLRLAPVWALGGALTVATIAGVLVARTHPHAPASAAPAVSAPGDMSQLQFATPGGTRIIWQFNPEFSFRETHP